MPELQKHTLNLRKGDYEYLGDSFSSKDVPAAMIIRMIVSNFVDKLKVDHEKIPAGLENIEMGEIE